MCRIYLRRENLLHKYLYAGGDPVNGFDPTGRDEEDYSSISFQRVKAVTREFGPFFVSCFKGLMDALGSDLQVLEYRDPLYFQEILERMAARWRVAHVPFLDSSSPTDLGAPCPDFRTWDCTDFSWTIFGIHIPAADESHGALPSTPIRFR
jgi:hypothetical protein